MQCSVLAGEIDVLEHSLADLKGRGRGNTRSFEEYLLR